MANTILTFLIDDIEYPSVSFTLISTSTTSEVSIDWGDDSAATTATLTGTNSILRHTYLATGTYNVEITVVSGTIGIPYAGGETSSISGYITSIVTGEGLDTVIDNSLGWIGNDESDWYVDVTIGPDVTSLGSPFIVSTLGDVVIDATGFNLTEGDSLIQQAHIKTLAFGSHVTAIPDNCFWDIQELTAITFGANVASIGHDIFSSCDDLTDLYFCGETPPTFESDSIDSELSLTIHVPTGTLSDYTTALATISPAPTLTIEEWDPPAPTPVYPESFVNNARLREVINETKTRLSTKQNVFQYSYAEVDTGKKWTNGKPIYCKTFSEGADYYSNVLPNIDRVIAVEAVGEALNAAVNPPVRWYLPPNMINNTSLEWGYRIEGSDLEIFANVPEGFSVTFVNFIITVYYTKTTD